MFNADFYPTPKELVHQMVGDLDLYGKVVYDPSAGSGNILDVVKEYGAEVICSEINEDLAKIAASKGDLIGYDFLQITKEQISHVDFIIMNPPFSSDEKHILHAWDICPDGCTIKALCNSETTDNRYSRNRKHLFQIIEESGFCQYLGNAFSTAERKTDVNVGLVTLFKPGSGDNEFDGYFDLTEEQENQEEGIIKYNEIREVVNRFVASVKMFDSVESAADEINSLASIFNGHSRIQFGAFKTAYNGSPERVSREAYKKELQKAAWKTVFSKMNMDKYVTQKVRDDINKFVEKQTNVPFTLKNVYKMVDMVFQTRGQTMDKAIIEVFDRLTQHYHDNRYNVEGWKTNSHYILNRKIIVPRVTEISFGGGMGLSYGGNRDMIEDLIKALCYLTGTDYKSIPLLHDFSLGERITNPDHYRTDEMIRKYTDWYNDLRMRHTDIEVSLSDYVSSKIEEDIKKSEERKKREFGTWYEWGFFRIKGYKKGTLHMEFLDERVWATLNQRIAKIKGFPLPESMKKS